MNNAYTRGVPGRSFQVALLAFALGLAGCGKLEPVDAGETAARKTATGPDPERYGGSANFIVNPSFEGTVAPWLPVGENTMLRATVGNAKAGRSSAFIGTSVPASYGAQIVGIVGGPQRGDEYLLTAWMRSADRAKRVTIQVHGGTAKESTVLAKVFRRIDQDWRQATVRVRVTQRDLLAIHLYFTVDGSIGSGDGFFLDGVTFNLEIPGGSAAVDESSSG